MNTATTSLVWFRNDLRLSDHAALHAAVNQGGPVICLFILDQHNPGEWKRGEASLWRLHHSLQHLSDSLEQLGQKLILRQGPAEHVLDDIITDTNTTHVFWGRDYEPWAIDRDTSIKAKLKDKGINVQSHNTRLLFEPWTVETGQGAPYKVFSPFWRACLASNPPERPLPAPGQVPAPDKWPATDTLNDWALLPTRPNWAHTFDDNACGERWAYLRLKDFLDTQVDDYKDNRDRPANPVTSGLSPALHFGEISPRAIWHTVNDAIDAGDVNAKSAQKFLSEIGWREFSFNLLYHFPYFPEKNHRDDFDKFTWRDSPNDLKAWQQGYTGYPMVDAGMRELWATGIMHNRVRMIVASFLTKHLMIHWRHGEDWFWDTLIDADLANNAASWQWVAGSGADAAPYFRIFNPFTQGEKFDTNGDYVRKWVPEIAGLPNKLIHRPWEASAAELGNAGIKLGETYPHPIVDHFNARDRALGAYEALKSAKDEPADA